MERPVLFFILTLLAYSSSFSDGNKDSFDNIVETMANVTDCTSMIKYKLTLKYGAVSQLPKFHKLDEIRHSNRSTLKHMHNMAFNRALFYSFIMQKLDTYYSFMNQPDWAYMSTATAADIHANEGVFNASAIYYDQNKHYPNWIANVDFNRTIPLFGPKAYQNGPRSGVVIDMGSGNNKNYTSPYYKMNPWYEIWFPEYHQRGFTHSVKHSVKIKYSTETGVFLSNDFQENHFYGPRLPGIYDPDGWLPVRFTQPYFDCGSTNKWVISAVSPIVDYLPRYTAYQHVRKHRYVGVAVMNIDFDQIDINPCPVSYGNEMPNDLVGIDKCDKRTTKCEPLTGYGFRRQGYTCGCRPGYHYPLSVQGPFSGTYVESHPNESECVPTENLLDKNTQTLNDTSSSTRKRRAAWHVSDILGSLFETKDEKTPRSKRSLNFNKSSYVNAKNMFKKVAMIDGSNCNEYTNSDLVLPSGYGYRANKVFDSQARFALRLAHFLSNHHQNVVHGEKTLFIFTSHRIHYNSIFGEVIANVMADRDILSSGVFYEPNQFVNEDGSTREYLGPLAYIRQDEFYAIDLAGFQTRYTEADWYKPVSSRWRTNTTGLKKYKMESFMRGDKDGNSTVKDPHSPIEYYAPSVDQGVWSSPYFRCDGQVDEWVMTYSVPFIGRDQSNNNLILKGVVTVDVPLKKLDVNQCPQQSSATLNGFDNTALCDHESTDCIPVVGLGLTSGGYKCVCKTGYEYPWNDQQSWYYGMELEAQYEKKMSGNSSNIFDKLKCRKTPVPVTQGPGVTPRGPVGVATSMMPIPAIIMIAACLLIIQIACINS